MTTPCPTTPSLVARLRAGEGAAYDELFRTHAAAMAAVARRFFGDTPDADEAVQDALVAVFRAVGRFEETCQLATWLHRVTVNACLMKLRSRRRSRLVAFADDVATTAGDPLTRAETCDRVRAGVARLPEAYRTVIGLREWEGLSTDEAAARLGTTPGVVKVRLHRARHALKAILDPLVAV